MFFNPRCSAMKGCLRLAPFPPESTSDEFVFLFCWWAYKEKEKDARLIDYWGCFTTTTSSNDEPWEELWQRNIIEFKWPLILFLSLVCIWRRWCLPSQQHVHYQFLVILFFLKQVGWYENNINKLLLGFGKLCAYRKDRFCCSILGMCRNMYSAEKKQVKSCSIFYYVMFAASIYKKREEDKKGQSNL